PGAREGVQVLQHRHRPASSRAALGPRARGVRARHSVSGLGAAERAAAERAERLRAYGVLDCAMPLAALEELVRRAQEVARFPVAWISFIDGARERLHAAR